MAKRDNKLGIKWLDLIKKCIALPLNFMRDYTVPMGELSAWDRNRAAIVPTFMPLAFFVLMGFVEREKVDNVTSWDVTFLWIGLICMVPGALLGIFIRFRMKASEPPKAFFTCYAILAFLMSIAWIN